MKAAVKGFNGGIWAFRLVFAVVIAELLIVAGAVVGAVVGAIKIDQIKEMVEQIAVEEVLSSYPYLVNFELKTSSLNGTK